MYVCNFQGRFKVGSGRIKSGRLGPDQVGPDRIKFGPTTTHSFFVRASYSVGECCDERLGEE